MAKMALLVLYNHNFEKNIEKIKNLYKGRFSYVYQLIPFYSGSDESVISVYENSYFFSSYLSQAYTQLKKQNFTHYFVVADDMVINPIVNEYNIFDILGLTEQDAYIPSIEPIQTSAYKKAWLKSVLEFRIEQNGLEVKNILPSKDIAESIFKSNGLPIGKMPFNYWFKPYQFQKNMWGKVIDFLVDLPLVFRNKMHYPVVKGYSDILIMPSMYMGLFSKYCGAFAAGRLFVEYAIPTSAVLSIEKSHLKTNNDINLKGMALWTKTDWESLELKYDKSLNRLSNEYPQNILYIHPVKLSRWN